MNSETSNYFQKWLKRQDTLENQKTFYKSLSDVSRWLSFLPLMYSVIVYVLKDVLSKNIR